MAPPGYVPLRLLAGAAHPEARLRDVLPRMRCKDCHDRPAAAALVAAATLRG